MFGLTGARAGLIDIAGMISRGITVCYTGGGPSVSSTAELALGLMLAAARRHSRGRRRGARRSLPARHARRAGARRQDARPGGARPDRRAHGGVWPCSGDERPRVEPESDGGTPRQRRVRRASTKDELFAAADVVSLHLVLSDRTRGIVGAADLARMKPGAILVNTARAPLVDESALVAAVQSRRIIAALDVFYREPLPPDHPLARASNVVLTPHLGYSVIEVYREYYQQSVENAWRSSTASRSASCNRQGTSVTTSSRSNSWRQRRWQTGSTSTTCSSATRRRSITATSTRSWIASPRTQLSSVPSWANFPATPVCAISRTARRGSSARRTCSSATWYRTSLPTSRAIGRARRATCSISVPETARPNCFRRANTSVFCARRTDDGGSSAAIVLMDRPFRAGDI